MNSTAECSRGRNLSSVHLPRFNVTYWLTVILVLAAIPYAWYEWGAGYNRNTTSTVGGPLTVGLSIFLSV
jgi:hypothetical protein